LDRARADWLCRPRVTDPGDTGLACGEIVGAAQLHAANAAATGRKAAAEPTIVGVSEAACATLDFIAAASSYGGAAALAKAAARKQKLPLHGIRSCTAFGKRMPTGGRQPA